VVYPGRAGRRSGEEVPRGLREYRSFQRSFRSTFARLPSTRQCIALEFLAEMIGACVRVRVRVRAGGSFVDRGPEGHQPHPSKIWLLVREAGLPSGRKIVVDRSWYHVGTW